MQTRFDQRENNFDFIRLSLAVLVIYSHSYVLGLGFEPAEPFYRLTRNQVTGGGIAIDLFFIISGFLVTASYERSASTAGYLKKRILRIYPGFIVTMLFELLLVLPVSGGRLVPGSRLRQALDFVLQTFRLHEFHYTGAFATLPHPGAMNGSTWSIQYEFWCYLAVILLGITGLLRSKKFLSIFFLSIVVFNYFFILFHWTVSIPNLLVAIFGFAEAWISLLPMYIAGVVFYKLRGHLSLNRWWIVTACAALVVAAMMPAGWTLLFPLAGAYLVLVLAFHPRIRIHGWSRYGDFSYGTYLYGFPIQQLIMRMIGHAIPAWKLFAMAVPPTLLCAIASWYLVERPFLLKVRRIAAPA